MQTSIYWVDPSSKKDSTSIEQTVKPKHLTVEIPEELIQLVQEPAIIKVTANEKVELMFLHKGLKLDQYQLKLKSGGKEQLFMVDVKKSLQLGKDQQIVSLDFTTPDWVKESLELEVLSKVDSKTVSIGKENLPVEE